MKPDTFSHRSFLARSARFSIRELDDSIWGFHIFRVFMFNALQTKKNEKTLKVCPVTSRNSRKSEKIVERAAWAGPIEFTVRDWSSSLSRPSSLTAKMSKVISQRTREIVAFHRTIWAWEEIVVPVACRTLMNHDGSWVRFVFFMEWKLLNTTWMESSNHDYLNWFKCYSMYSPYVTVKLREALFTLARVIGFAPPLQSAAT